MDPRLAWVLVVGAAVALFALTAAGPKRRAKPKRVLLVGDSLAVGLAGPLGSHLRAGGVDVAAGVKGATIAGFWQPKLDAMLRDHQPELVLFSLGTNDCRFEESRACADFQERTRDLAEQCHTRGARPVFLIPAWLSWAQRIRDRLTYGADSWEPSAWPELQRDQIHPTAAGYKTWAADLAGRIK